MQIDFVTVDVFTTAKFGGNPLAVVLDARGLASAQMQAIAAEFNLAETTFVLPPQDPATAARTSTSPPAPSSTAPASALAMPRRACRTAPATASVSTCTNGPIS